MRTVKRRAPRIMQRITGREKMPGSGAEPKMIPEERRGPSGFMRFISSEEPLCPYPGPLLSLQGHEVTIKIKWVCPNPKM